VGGKPRSRRTLWIIWVAGYGAFEFVGTEAEAEEMRAHKAVWEHAVAKKFDTGLSRHERTHR
jgi:hypothetical protein